MPHIMGGPGLSTQQKVFHETPYSKCSGSPRKTRVHHHHHHHHHQSISKSIDDVRMRPDEVQNIRKDLEEARAVQAEQVCQQTKLTGMMELVQAAITVDDSMKIRLANNESLKKECSPSGFINVSDVQEDNFNDGSPGFNQGK